MEQGRSFYASISGPNMPRIYGVEVILGKALGWWTRTWGLGRRPGRGGVSEREGKGRGPSSLEASPGTKGVVLSSPGLTNPFLPLVSVQGPF